VTTSIHRPAGTLELGLARGGVELKTFFRQKEAVVFTFSLPVVLLVILGTLFSGEVVGTGITVGTLFTAGMIAAGIASTSFVNLGISIATDRDDGTLKRLRGAPMPAASYFVGKVVLVLVASLAEAAIVVGIGFLLLVSLAASAWLAAVGKFFAQRSPLPVAVMETANALLSFVTIALMFAVIYKLLPDVRITWRNVWVGAAVTALLFTMGKSLIGLYLGRSTVASVYGAAGSLVVILLWIYYSAQVVFFGAEFTKVYSRRFGAAVLPDPLAVPLTAKARAAQGMDRRKRALATLAGLTKVQ